MKKSIVLTLSSALLLASCASSPSFSTALSSSKSEEGSKDITEINPSSLALVTPKGIPALAFYDQGNNTNWQSYGEATQVAPFFATDNVDFIVFDGTNGLTNLKNNNRNYKFARWISGGTFYIVSTKHESLSEYSKGQSIDAFVKAGNASLAFRTLAEKKWNWGALTDDDVKYETGVAAVKTNIETNADAYDYYVVAEPVLWTLKKTITFKMEVSLQEEWAALYPNETIPAAGLFVNSSSYNAKKDQCDAFIISTMGRVNTAIEEVAKVTKALNEYGASNVPTRFGFPLPAVNALQADGKNGFGLVSSQKQNSKEDRMKIANDFARRVGLAEYPASLFLD